MLSRMSTPARQQYVRLMSYVAAHNCSLAKAARALGVNPATARAWRKRFGAEVELPDTVPTNETLERVKGGTIRGSTTATVEQIDAVCVHLMEGVSRRSATTLAGVPYASLVYWYREGEKEPDGPYGWVALKVDAAEAAAERAWLEQLCKLAKGNKGSWKAYAWLLERRHRHTWGRLEIRTPDGKVVEGDDITSRLEEALTEMTPEQLAAMVSPKSAAVH